MRGNFLREIVNALFIGTMREPAKYPERPGSSAELHDAGDFDPVVEAYKQHVDRTILRENLKLSPQERSEKFLSFMENVWHLREVAAEARRC